MKKDLTLIGLGVWIAIVPFLGFPGTWKTAIFVVSGLAVALLTILWRHELIRSHSLHQGNYHDVFVENGHVSQNVNRRRLRVADSDEVSGHDKTQNSA